jgi:predicted HD superfamily hydrolase involved in NAD metabolism
MHSINVMETSIELAEKYGADAEKAGLAGLLHDCARDVKNEDVLGLCQKYGVRTDEITREYPGLLHGQLGACLARDLYGAEDPEVLEAIACHTMGRSGMPLISRIVFLADYIEPARHFPGVEEIRRTADESLEKAMLMGIDNTIGYILEKGQPLHPDTVITRNWVLTELKLQK